MVVTSEALYRQPYFLTAGQRICGLRGILRVINSLNNNNNNNNNINSGDADVSPLAIRSVVHAVGSAGYNTVIKCSTEVRCVDLMLVVLASVVEL